VSANNRPSLRRSLRILSSTPNRSDVKSSMSEVPNDVCLIPRQRVLQAVVIPKMESRIVRTSDLRQRASSRTSFRTSSASSSSGEPIGHETPDTSAVNTPGADSSLQMGLVNNKRKRSSILSANVVNARSADADLARLLQDEECAGPSHIRPNHSISYGRVSIDLTADSDTGPLSSPISVSSFLTCKLWRALN
jgi:hypothetical protein